jgi:CPA1 family monovalent cation:H+ antiporter
MLAPLRHPRVPIFAVWETLVFVLNAFAFVLAGMQLRQAGHRPASARPRSPW